MDILKNCVFLSRKVYIILFVVERINDGLDNKWIIKQNDIYQFIC